MIKVVWYCLECDFCREGDAAETCGDDSSGEMMASGPWCDECGSQMLEDE